MDPLPTFAASMVGYMCGSISFARLVGRAFAPGKDVTHTEITAADGKETVVVGAISATAVSMHLGPKYGFLTVVLDMLKVAIPVIVFRWRFPETSLFLIAALAGMVGHIWPVYYRFKGGRGLSSVYGGLFAIDWIAVFVVSVGGMLLGLLILRNVFVAYMAGLWLLVPWLWFRTHDLGHVGYAVAVNIVFVIAMLPEIKQMVRLQREGKQLDMIQAMQLTGMGRGIYKMAKKLGVVQDVDTAPEGEDAADA
jgi:glycerol-3-phosphate acyltransferase PlsY